jgi:hypothetical protein
MDRDRAPVYTTAHGRVGRIVVRGEFGPLLAAALPECEIAVLSGETVKGDSPLPANRHRLGAVQGGGGLPASGGSAPTVRGCGAEGLPRWRSATRARAAATCRQLAKIVQGSSLDPPDSPSERSRFATRG